MLDFDKIWFPVLVANFLILFAALKILLFDPIYKIMKERDASIKGSLDDAKNLNLKKEEAIVAMNKDLQEARIKAKESFNELRDEGLARQKEAMTATESEAVAMLEKARTELQAEAQKARAALKADVEGFASEIVNKLVKV